MQRLQTTQEIAESHSDAHKHVAAASAERSAPVMSSQCAPPNLTAH